MSQLYRSLSYLTAFVLLVVGAASCGDIDYVSEQPPDGYNPPVGGSGAGSGYGANYPGGSAGTGGDPGPPPCPEEHRRCAYLFSYPSEGSESSVEVRGDFAANGWEVGVAMTLDQGTWSAEVDLPWDTDVQYKFVIDGTTWITDPNNPNQVDDGFGGYNSLIEGFTCDEWICDPPLVGDFDWRDAVLYFAFVDRFLDGDPSNNGSPVSGVETPANYQGGDWAGVLSKIESGYFTSLGVNALWLSVPMNNTDSSGLGTDGHLYSAYHGYWPTDLEVTESRFGSVDELVALVEAAHENDIRVIVDYAMNHVHQDSPVWQDHEDWFWPLDNGGSQCVCGGGCSWDGPEGKRCWFTSYLPDFNFNVAAARDFSVSNAIEWIQTTGIDGYRLDAVKHIEDAWITDLRARVTDEIESVTEQHFYMVGETFTGDRDLIRYYVDPTTMLDGQFDFPLRASIISALLLRNGSMSDLDDFIAGNIDFYGAGIMSTFIGNHDVPRAVHFAQDYPEWSDPWTDGKDKAWNNTPGLPVGTAPFERLATAYTMLFTLPGVPLIYYGDEIGLPGAGDPDNRRFMQWSGYSDGQELLRDHISALAAIRAEHVALRHGSRETLSVGADTMAYRMQEGSDSVFVVLNRSDGSATAGGLPSGSYVDLLDSSSHSGPEISVPARSSRVLVPE